MCENKTLKNKTVTGMIWSFSDTLGRQLVQFIVQIVLARLILPEDFGLIGMVTVFITLSQVFVDSGFTKGLIREKKSTQEDYSTVFLFNLLIAVIIYIILFNSAGLIANFFGEPKLV
ncbi:MAG: oligosaccharide flippase family protein, partial [archaeon]